MRAKSVSPFWNFAPLLPSRDSMSLMSIASLERQPIGTKGFSPSRGTVTRGLRWTQSGARLTSQPLGMAPRGGGDARELFVAGEAEVDEPLAVEGAGHRLQNPDAPLTVLHQLVVGRQDARNPPLHRQRGNGNVCLSEYRVMPLVVGKANAPE